MALMDEKMEKITCLGKKKCAGSKNGEEPIQHTSGQQKRQALTVTPTEAKLHKLFDP